MIGIIAAGGESSRTGLGAYTTKAAFMLAGRSLLSYQIDFLRSSGILRIYVVCQKKHAALLEKRLSSSERSMVTFVFSEKPSGWVGEVERVLPQIARYAGTDDDVTIISCDNYHAPGISAEVLGLDRDAVFTYTEWKDSDHPPTSGLVLARSATVWGTGKDVWIPRSGLGFTGAFFSGYVVVRGGVLTTALRDVQPIDGKKEIVSLLSVLAQSPRCEAVPYPGDYVDVANIQALAHLDAKLRGDGSLPIEKPGACVLVHNESGERVLLIKRADGRGWAPPGGIVEEGETYAKGAIREVLEEIGVMLDEQNLRLLGVYPTVGKFGGAAVTVVWKACSRENTRFRLASREVHDIRWFDRAAAEKKAIPFRLGEAVRDYFEGRELDVR